MADKKEVVVAIDFGTTFSAIAWAQVLRPESHYVIKQWPVTTTGAVGGKTSEKVPTEVAFEYGNDEEPPKLLWGFQMHPAMPRLQWFKLALDPEKTAPGSTHPEEYKDRLRMEIPHHATPESLITDYLRAIVDHFKADVMRQVGSVYHSMVFRYIITVPAIWSERAKVKTLECAKNSGLGSDILIVSEPEAAAIHALQPSNPHGLEAGDTIVICDAGGGTVDLITFTITQLTPKLILRESAPGTGQLCGSTFLNRRFETFLREQLESEDGWENDTLERAMEQFDSLVKCRFTGGEHETFTVPVPGIQDSPSLNVRRGHLHISGKDLCGIFLPVFQDIGNLVEKQIHDSKENVNAVFLVGGFGQNTFLREYLHSRVPSKVKILQPVDGWTSVARGALTKALSELYPEAQQVLIESRVARKHYGEKVHVKFHKAIHDKKRRHWDPFHGEWRISVMDWFIKKGDQISESQPIIHQLFQKRLSSEGRYKSIKTTIYELDSDEEPPMYFNRFKMRTHATLHPDLEPIMRCESKEAMGADGKRYYRIHYDVQAKYHSAHCDYSLWIGGSKQGTVSVQYF